jgi:hypothetical protein
VAATCVKTHLGGYKKNLDPIACGALPKNCVVQAVLVWCGVLGAILILGGRGGGGAGGGWGGGARISAPNEKS